MKNRPQSDFLQRMFPTFIRFAHKVKAVAVAMSLIYDTPAIKPSPARPSKPKKHKMNPNAAAIVAVVIILAYGLVVGIMALSHDYSEGWFLPRFYTDGLLFLIPIVFVWSYSKMTGQPIWKPKAADAEKSRLVSVLYGLQKRHPFLVRHLDLTICVSLGVLVIIGVSYFQYFVRFSDDDFVSMSSSAEQVFKELGAKEVVKNQSCDTYAPAEFEPRRLYCSVEVAAYLNYQDDDQAIAVAKRLERAISRQGTPDGNFSRFYDKPQDGSESVNVRIRHPKSETCSYSINSNGRARRAIYFLPERQESDLIALSFQCSAESRAFYFEDYSAQAGRRLELKEKDGRDIRYARRGVRVYTPSYLPNNIAPGNIMFEGSDPDSSHSIQNFYGYGGWMFAIFCTNYIPEPYNSDEQSLPKATVVAQTKEGASIYESTYNRPPTYLTKVSDTYVTLQFDQDGDRSRWEELKPEVARILSDMKVAN